MRPRDGVIVSFFPPRAEFRVSGTEVHAPYGCRSVDGSKPFDQLRLGSQRDNDNSAEFTCKAISHFCGK